MTFQPYTFRQLERIVSSRMSGLKVFDNDAIQLAARKVAAVSGDARRALDICRRSTEIAEAEGKAAAAANTLVRICHVDQALQEMFSSPKILAIRWVVWLGFLGCVCVVVGGGSVPSSVPNSEALFLNHSSFCLYSRPCSGSTPCCNPVARGLQEETSHCW